VAFTVWASPLLKLAKFSVRRSLAQSLHEDLFTDVSLQPEGLQKGLVYRTPRPDKIVNPDEAAEEPEFRVWFKWKRNVEE